MLHLWLKILVMLNFFKLKIVVLDIRLVLLMLIKVVLGMRQFQKVLGLRNYEFNKTVVIANVANLLQPNLELHLT